jgi:regulator of protease activity HflC (stomatin/prohibitin superfamily)
MKAIKLLHVFSIFCVIAVAACRCNNVLPNYEGVLMTGYGRNGISDFKAVTGSQGILGPGSELYHVPMFEQKADPTEVTITAKDAGVFTVDPSYTYSAFRGQGVAILFDYKHLGVDNPDEMMDKVEAAILNQLVVDAYREAAGNYTTDSLMNNRNSFEQRVEDTLRRRFAAKHFELKPNGLTSGLKPPASMAAAIEARNTAIQKANEVRNQLETSKMMLEKAKIDAEANRMTATGLDPRVLQERWIEAIRNTSNKVIITDGRTPILFNQ